MKVTDYIDKIQSIRADNNAHWMDILRLALRVAPDETKELIRKIIEKDRQVIVTLEEMLEKQ